LATHRNKQHDVEEEAASKAYDHILARRLLRFLKPYSIWVAAAVGLLLIHSLLQLAGPWITKVAIDDHIAFGDLEGLRKMALLYLGVVLVGFSLQYVQFYVMQWVGQRVMFDLRRSIMQHLQRQELAYFDHNPVGRLMTRLTGDIQALHELFTSGVVAIFGDLLTLTGIIIVMFLLDWRLALVANLVLPVLFAVSTLFRSRVRRNYRNIRSRVAAINSYLQEHITGMRVVQLFGREPQIRDDFAHLNDRHRQSFLKTIHYYSLFFPTIEFISAIAIAMILWYGGGRVGGALLGDGVSTAPIIELGVLVAFLQYAERFFRPISDLSEKYNTLQAAMAAAERIFELLDRQPRIVSPSTPQRLQRARGHLLFDNVRFGYNDNEEVLHGISFEVRAGERVALVGATGAGKTSILSILTRLYDIQQGSILLDGIDLRQLALPDLRRQVGIVLQDAFMFAGDISQNIRLGNTAISEQQIRQAAETVHAHSFIERLPQGYQTVLTERGSTLSMGQRQLLSLARVMAYDPAILVLDEATSSIDTHTEEIIQGALHQVMKGRTSLVVAHRLSTIQDCDRILVLHKGVVEESGTHRELLQLKGLYARLYDLQFKDQAA
jgi:ATP-binding cassette subfamily B multidrug efflux pump